MHRVLVLGAQGAGKSTLAEQLGSILGLPAVDLDDFYWESFHQLGRDPTSEEVHEAVSLLAYRDTWIIAGNHPSALEERLTRCDVILLLDLPGWLCAARVVVRRVRLAGRLERPLRPNEWLTSAMLRAAWSSKPRARALGARVASVDPPKPVILLRTRSQVARVLTACRQCGSAALAREVEHAARRGPLAARAREPD